VLGGKVRRAAASVKRAARLAYGSVLKALISSVCLHTVR
jgi:hypothetical protein